MNYYPHHIGDYMLATAHLSETEDLAYRRMLDLYYRDESPLPDDAGRIAKLIRMPDRTAEVGAVLNEFFRLEDGVWRQKRCDSEIAKYSGNADRARNNGRNGGRPRGKKATEQGEENPEKTQRVSSGFAERTQQEPRANPELTQKKANQNQNQNQNIPSSNELGARGARPPPADDPIKRLFDLGVDVLTKAGESERRARELIGLARKEAGDTRTFEILSAARDKTNPAAYIVAAIKPKPKQVSL